MFSRDHLLERLRLPSNDPHALVVDPPPLEIEHGVLDLHFSGQMLRLRRDLPNGEEIRADAVTLQPGEFGLALTLERVHMPLDLSGELVGRSIWNRRGLQVMSASAIDPAFSGQITFEVTNFGVVGPLEIRRGVAVAQLWFHEVTDYPRNRPIFAPYRAAIAVGSEGTAMSFHGTEVVRVAELDLLAQPWIEDTPRRTKRSEAVGELEELIRRPRVSESELQRFFEHHSWLLLGQEYLDIRPQIVLQRADEGTLRPDFFLKPVVGDSWDILDLKLPQIRPLIVGRADRRMYSQKVAAGIAQLRRYGRYFDDDVNRRWVEAKHGIFAYRPRLMLLIGLAFESDQRETRLDVRRSSEVDVLTYEELLARVKYRMQSDE